MKNFKFARIIVLVLSLALLIGSAMAITASAEETESASTGKFGSISLAYADKVAIRVQVDATAEEINSGDVVVSYELNGKTADATYHETDSKGRVWVITEGIAYYDLGQIVTFSSKVGDTLVESGRTYSVAQFLYKMLNTDSGITEEYRNLYQKTLECGEAAQIALGINADKLVTASTFVKTNNADVSINGKSTAFAPSAGLAGVTPTYNGTIPEGQCISGWTIRVGETDSTVGTSFDCSGVVEILAPIFIDHVDGDDNEACDNCGTEMLKPRYTVTINYGSKSKTVEVKEGNALTEADLTLDSKYPFAVVEWQKDGVAYDTSTPVTEAIELTAVLANEAVYEDFETEGAWNTSNASKVTYTHITEGAISGNQSLQFTTTAAYNGVYRQNLTDKIDFSDVNYIYFKARVSADAKITFRFFNANNIYGSYLQVGQEIKADGNWHLVCLDLSTLSGSFTKEETKAMFIMTNVAVTVDIDDMVFARDEIIVEEPDDGTILTYDFNDEEGWYFSGSTTSMAIATDDNGNSIMSGTIGGWGAIYVKDLSGLGDLNYLYVKVKTSTAFQLRVYAGDNMSTSPRRAIASTTVGTTSDGYTILKFDLTNLSSISPTNGDFEKADIQMFALVRNASGAATYDIDQIVLASEEITFE